MSINVWNKYKWPLLFSLIYFLIFSTYFLTAGDNEFLFYVAVMIFFFLLLLGTITHTKLSLVSVWGLSLWGFLHMAGGGIPVGDGVLYGHIIYPIIDRGGEFVIFKFDQLVHFFGFGVATLVMYEIIKPRWRGSLGLLAFVVALAGMGLGALNEVVEFMAVVFMPETGVGGYYNTGLDLVFNAIGATVVALVLYKWKK